MKRFGFGLVLLICCSSGHAAQESAGAAKVAAWLRSAAPVDSASSHFSVLGLQNFNGLGQNAENTLSAQGPATFYQNTQATQEARNVITSRMSLLGPLLQAGGISAFRDVANLPWGMIETAQGQYNFSLMDVLIQNYQTYGVDYVGVAMPFASWDLASRPPVAQVCKHFFTEDYKYLAAAGKMDRYVNLDAFATMLQTTVERYDGDGVNDMAGLTRPVKYWQLQNEPEGADCGQFRNDVASFVEFMKRGYSAVKAACADCKVMNGGAGLVDKTKNGGNFWWDYASLGGKAYLDIIALHFNDGKSPGVQDVALFETALANIKDALGADKPIWMTEFGVVVDVPPGGFVSLSETQAASWYMRFYAAGLNGGVKRFFSDAQSFISTQSGNSATLLLPYYTNKLMEAKLGNFSTSAKLAAGQYRFTVNGSPVYVLWTGVPAELSGTVTAYDMYGTESTSDAASLKPTQDQPLIVVTGTAQTQGKVVEFYNPDLDHYFITADAGEQAMVDSGAVGRWQRTGGSFNAGGAKPVCRFYGNGANNPATGIAYGPNSHFFTADADECNGLKARFNANAKSWKFESNDFMSTPPTAGACSTGLAPVYRAYNNGALRGVDANHRITGSSGAYQQAIAVGWVGEGVVMCATQ